LKDREGIALILRPIRFTGPLGERAVFLKIAPWARVFRCGALLAFVLSALGQPTGAKALNPPEFFLSGVVTEVTDYGLFQFAGQPYLLKLWGLHVHVAELRPLLVGRELLCKTHNVRRERDDPTALIEGRKPLLVYCMVVEHGSVARWLIELGHAKENCRESRNAFDTCR
jgi:hypothetical protein